MAQKTKTTNIWKKSVENKSLEEKTFDKRQKKRKSYLKELVQTKTFPKMQAMLFFFVCLQMLCTKFFSRKKKGFWVLSGENKILHESSFFRSQTSTTTKKKKKGNKVLSRNQKEKLFQGSHLGYILCPPFAPFLLFQTLTQTKKSCGYLNQKKVKDGKVLKKRKQLCKRTGM